MQYFYRLDLQLTNQLEPVEEPTSKTGVKGLSEKELDTLNEQLISFSEK